VSDTFLERVLDRLEAHAPGLRARIVGHAVHTPVDLEAKNPNLVGGDLGGGSMALDQQLVFRPVPGWFRYATPVRGLYLCSASAHPGGGVHGMAGRNCARRVLTDARLRRV
jgi:phytoene dehydrogenase-like protein